LRIVAHRRRHCTTAHGFDWLGAGKRQAKRQARVGVFGTGRAPLFGLRVDRSGKRVTASLSDQRSVQANTSAVILIVA
jgi:hypothetical protein